MITKATWRAERTTVKDENGYTVASVNTAEQARLIAAAPDLVRALSISRGQWVNSICAQACWDALDKAGLSGADNPPILQGDEL